MRVGFLKLVASVLLIGLSASCASIKPYQKEYLLSPVMDDASIQSLQPGYAKSNGGLVERLATGTSGGGGTSCPTCGG
jgi:hypothetical protein